MKNTKKILRSAIYTALNGNITYSGGNVPVYDEKVKSTTTSNLFIILSTQQETSQDNNDSCFITRSSIDIEIVNKTGSEVSKDINDDVEDSMLTILLPTTNSIGITVPSGFQFQEAIRESSLTQNLTLSPTESILITRVKLTFIITEK